MDEANIKLKVGDKVEIIKYGHLIWETANWDKQIVEAFGPSAIDPNKRVYCTDMDGRIWVDISPELIGQQGTITKFSSGGGGYSLEGIKGKTAWYTRSQLKKIPNDEQQSFIDYIDKVVEFVASNIYATPEDENQSKLLLQVKTKYKEICQLP